MLSEALGEEERQRGGGAEQVGGLQPPEGLGQLRTSAEIKLENNPGRITVQREIQKMSLFF